MKTREQTKKNRKKLPAVKKVKILIQRVGKIRAMEGETTMSEEQILLTSFGSKTSVATSWIHEDVNEEDDDEDDGDFNSIDEVSDEVSIIDGLLGNH